VLKTSTPVLRRNTGRANRESCRFKEVLTGMAMLKVSTVVLVMQERETDQQGLIQI